jgi:mannose-6-phosphate isomerase-like protein (cupin superfamily)
MKISISNAEHYNWGSACDGWHLVKTPGLSVIQERMPAGTAETRHTHQQSRQFFYVLAGTLTMEVDGAVTVLGAGVGLEIPPQIPHQARNESELDVEFLVISQPTTRGDRINFD